MVLPEYTWSRHQNAFAQVPAMKVEYINPFLTSAIHVFRTMLNCELVRDRPVLKSGWQPAYEVSGIIGLTGKARGTVVLSLERETALQVTAVMLGDRPPEINRDVIDAVGELTNMIAGGAKAQLESLAMSVSLPTVITGKGHCIDFPKSAPPIAIPFNSQWGAVMIEVGLVELPHAD